MKKFLFIATACIFVATIKSMQDEELQSCWSLMPLDLMVAIKDDSENNNTIVYPVFDAVGFWAFPYTLRNINPVKLIPAGCINREEKVLLNPRYWYLASRLSYNHNNHNNVHNHFQFYPTNWRKNSKITLFDGINNNQLSLVANADGSRYKVYALKQTNKDARVDTNQKMVNPVIAGTGNLRSILLHRERNRCVLGIKGTQRMTKRHRIDIKNISETHSRLIASRVTDFVLKKAIHIGNRTYLGLTEEGNMVVFWLNNKNRIKYAHQNCHGKQFKDIDVDETITTKSGLMPRVGLLTTNGDVFLTDLRMGGEKKILLYSRTLENPHNTFRFFYDKGQCAVVYNKNGAYDTFHVWPDNFNLLLVCISLKRSQGLMISEEK